MILGYRHPAIVEAMRRQAELPTDYGAQHELEFLVSEQVQKLMPGAELCAFTSSGSEACQIAFRPTRALRRARWSRCSATAAAFHLAPGISRRCASCARSAASCSCSTR